MPNTPSESSANVTSQGAQGIDSFFRQDVAPQNAPARQGAPIDTSSIDAVADREGLSTAQRQVMGALLGQESGGNPNAPSSIDGAHGPGQIMPATFKQYAKAGESIDNPDHNLSVMARIVKDLGAKSGDDPAKMAAGYFSGPGNMGSGAAPFKSDTADGNGKRVSSYVTDVLARLTGSGAAQASDKVAPVPPAAPADDPLAKAPKWGAVIAKPEYQAMSDADKAGARDAYFQTFIEPGVPPEQRGQYRDWFNGEATKAEDAAKPSVWKAVKGAVSGVVDNVGKMFEPAPTGGVMDGMPQTDHYAGDQYDISKVGMKVAQANRNALDARQAAQIQEINRQQIGEAGPSNFDFEAQDKFNKDPFFSHPLVRGAVKGYHGFKQGVLGVDQFAADMVGADDFAAGMAGANAQSRAFTATMGEPHDRMKRNFEGAISSISQQLPMLIGGAATGSEGLVLGSMFTQTFGQEYSDGRAQGQSIGDATTRAGIFGAFEVVGEKFGLGKTLTAIKMAAHGAPTNELAHVLAHAAMEEIPGEELTTLGQFLTDKLPGGVGLNTQASFGDYLDQAADTLITTVMQSGMMMGGTSGVSAAVRYGREHGQSNKLQTTLADAAQENALAKWQAFREQMKSTPTPTRVEPTLGPVDAQQAAPTPHIQAAAEQVAATAPSKVAPQDILDYADSRYRQLRAARDGESAQVVGEDGALAAVDQPGAGLTDADHSELAALEANRGNSDALGKMYGFDLGAPTKDVVDQAAHAAATSPLNDHPEPTQAQKEAGNYKVGRVALHGLDISIENPEGSVRRGTAPDGKEWSNTLANHYGYIRKTEGADGDHVDTFVGPNPQSMRVYVVDQIDPGTGKYDEHKVMLGFDSQQEADAAYHANYEHGWAGRAAITETTIDQFKGWLKDGDTTQPFAKETPTNVPERPQVPEEGQAAQGAQGSATTFTTSKGSTYSVGKNGSTTRSKAQRAEHGNDFGTKNASEKTVYASSDAMAALNPSGIDGVTAWRIVDHKDGTMSLATKNADGTWGIAPSARNVPVSVAPATGLHPVELWGHGPLNGHDSYGSIHPGNAIVSINGAMATHADLIGQRDQAISDYRAAAEAGDELAAQNAERTLKQAREKLAAAHLAAAGQAREQIAAATEAINAPGAQAKPMTEKAARERREVAKAIAAKPPVTPVAVAAEFTPEQQNLTERAVKQGIIRPATLRGTNFRAGIIDATNGLSPQQNTQSYLDGHAFALKSTGKTIPTATKETVNASQTPQAVQAKTEQQEKAAPEAVKQTAPRTEKEAKAQRTAAKVAAPADISVPAPVPAARSTKTAAPIADFGETLEGARKHYAAAYADKMKAAGDVDIAAEPLSKSWPEPDYGKLLDGGADPSVVAFVHAARDEVPNKPTARWKLKGWAEKVALLRETSNKLLSGDIDAEMFAKHWNRAEFSSLRNDMDGRIELYKAVGHEKSLKGVTLSSGSYSVHNGVPMHPPKIIWAVEKQAKATSFSNWPRELATGSTRAEAIANFTKRYASMELDQAAVKTVAFDIYTSRAKPGQFIIGKKVGKEYLDLKSFDSVAAAREYKAGNQAALEKMLEDAKAIPSERNDTNSPRAGIDHRAGADVTPEVFSEAFGFRGVQFGNYVEDARRQKDLNDAYDALMDMAAVIGVPAKALSLNGELGLAFGARGKGGKRPAKAHYERGTIVINLTKNEGAGSLAHEWWHALDNYFARLRKDKAGMATDYFPVALASRGSKYIMLAGDFRKEMVDAFGQVLKAVTTTGIKERSKTLDRRRTSDYWSTAPEMTARAFESYVINKLKDQGQSNDYLANIVPEEAFKLEDGYPYPTAGEMPTVRAAFDGFFRTIETRDTDKGVAFNDMAGLTSGPLARLDEPVRVATLAKLKSLTSRVQAGKLTDAEFQYGVTQLIGSLQHRNESKTPAPRERGPAWITERLMRARRLGEIQPEAADLALWALEQNPAMAHDLGISLRQQKDATAGNYNPASRIITLFKGGGNVETAVHEILHHTERMMPVEVQDGIVKEWSRAWSKAWKDADTKTRTALEDMILASAGKRAAHDRMVKAFETGVLKYDEHYQLVNASEFWAVNAAAIMDGRYQARGSWAARAKQWLGEMLEKVKGLLGMASDAPVLAGVNEVLNSDGARVSKDMLVELSGKKAADVHDIARSQIGTPAFKKWFGDSKVVDTEGKPLMAYHGTTKDFASFDLDKLGNNTGHVTTKMGFFFSADPGVASIFNTKVDVDQWPVKLVSQRGATTMPVYLSIKNPLEMTVASFRELEPWTRAELIKAGYDGVRIIGESKLRDTMGADEWRADTWVALNPEQIKSAIANNGAYDSANPSILHDIPNQRERTESSQAELIKEFGKPTFSNIDWWDKSIGTQFHKAEKNPHFKKVFDLAVKRENAISLTTIRAAELAPAFLPRIDDFKSAAGTLIKGRKASQQQGFAADAIIAGTLHGENVLDGRVWSADELRAQFGMNDHGVMLYQQARAAIDASLDEVAAAEGFAALQMVVPRGLRELVMDDPRNARATLNEAIDRRINLDEMRIRGLERAGAPAASVTGATTTMQNAIEARETMEKVFRHSKLLKEAGYAPLMRFGKHFVSVEEVDPETGKTVINPDSGAPNTLYFGRFETEGEAEAEYFRQQVAHRGDASVSVKSGPINDEKYKMYQGVSPETLELFAEVVGAKDAMHKFYQVAVSERSALKRRLDRKSIAGFSQDIPRVLSNFITSNGRHAAGRYYTRDIGKAVKYIPREKGDVQKEAQRLKEYVDNPGEGGAMASSLAFTWFLGGNIASAVINATQPVMMTLPYLTQWGGVKAAAALTRAVPYAMGKKQITDAALRTALKRAGQEGKVDAQEIFHLYSVGIQGVAGALTNKLGKLPLVGGKVKGASEDLRARMTALGTLWGMPFAMVEGFNRRLSFIAAWDMAVSTNQADPYEFAVKAVDATQGIYNKVNRPNWARSPAGRVLFTFAQFKIMNVELLKRMATMGGLEGKKAAAMYLAVLILAAGTAGLPYADDIDDVIDTAGQWLGYNTNMKRTKRAWAYKILGKGFGDLALYGASSHLPLDFGGRMGLGNIIPATGLLKPSGESNRTQEFLELGGPVVSGLGKQVLDAYDAASMGDLGKAAGAIMPSSVKNASAGLDMATTGKAMDMKGKMKADVNLTEALSKSIGFSPTKLANANRTNMPIQQDLALQRITESNIVELWAQGAAKDDQEMMDRAKAKMEDWNKKNPDTPVMITAKQITSKARQILTPAADRLQKSAPREMRQRVAEGLDSDN